MAIKIGLDAGHSEESRGTYSVESVNDNLFEDYYTLDLCLMIEKKLLANGFEVFLTRKDEKAVGDSSDRAKACVKAGCNFAVSIHFNGFGNASANGTEVYVPYAEKAANIEVGFYNCLTKFFKERKPFARSSGTKSHATILDKKLNLATKKFDAVSNETDYFGFIRTSWQNGLSADLLEVCFLTNRQDFDTYWRNREDIADGLARAIVEGFGKKYDPNKGVVELPKPQKPVEEEKPVEPEKPKKKSVGSGRLKKNRVDTKC